jgi:hypothetical protein
MRAGGNHSTTPEVPSFQQRTRPNGDLSIKKEKERGRKEETETDEE